MKRLIILNGQLIFPDRIDTGKALICKNGKIEQILADKMLEINPDDQIIDAKQQYVSPGFIDMHVHGGGGHDFMDGTVEAFLRIAEVHAKYGTTAMVPTTLTCTDEELMNTFTIYKKAKVLNNKGAKFIGLHLEGPYFSPSQCGAQDPNYLKKPCPKEYNHFINISQDIVRWSIAPELDTEYVIYEQPQPKNPDMPQPDMASPDTENPYLDKPDTEKPAELNIEKSNTQKQNIYGSSTDSIPFRDCAADCLPERKGRDAMSLTEIESYRELIQENIGYEYLCQQYETYREDLDEIVELIVETVCAKRKTTRIAGSDFPHEIVRSRFLKLDNSHIEFVMDCLQKNTTEIRNMKQYLLTVLFNAPTTISNRYTSQVNHDLYGGW